MSPRNRAVRVSASAIAVCAILAVMLARSAAAYTFIDNNYPAAPVGCTNGLDWEMPLPQYHYCERWHLNSSGYSIHVKVYLDPSVTSNRPAGETFNWSSETSAAFARWNAVPARSPFLDLVSTLGSSTYDTVDGRTFYTKIYRDGNVMYPDIASTTLFTRCNASATRNEYHTCPDLNAYDPNWAVAFQMDVSTYFVFRTHGTTDPPLPAVDGTWVLMHELGHALGLGHTGFLSLEQPIYNERTYKQITPSTQGGGDVQGLQVYYAPSFCLSCPH
jgi:hypothetical protein